MPCAPSYFRCLIFMVLSCRCVICNSADLAPECSNPHDSRSFQERILLYDKHPGGTGVSLQVSNGKLNHVNIKKVTEYCRHYLLSSVEHPFSSDACSLGYNWFKTSDHDRVGDSLWSINFFPKVVKEVGISFLMDYYWLSFHNFSKWLISCLYEDVSCYRSVPISRSY